MNARMAIYRPHAGLAELLKLGTALQNYPSITTGREDTLHPLWILGFLNGVATALAVAALIMSWTNLRRKE